MYTERRSKPVHTVIGPEDAKAIHRLLKHLGPHAELEPLRPRRPPTGPAVWSRIVSQVCVMGSARGMESLRQDEARYKSFVRDMSLDSLAAHRFHQGHIAAVLRSYGATRFHNQAAKRLKRVIKSPEAVRDGRCIVINGLGRIKDPMVIRDTLIARCPVFKLKSASDFMISVGLSHDVLALDVRIVGALQRYLDYNLTAAQVQGRRDVYLSVEGVLRKVCRKAKAPLALLDRVLFQFGGMSALEYVTRFR